MKFNKTISLLQDGLKKVVNGLTSFEEILRVIDIETDFGDGDEELRAALLGKVVAPKKEENNTDNNNEQSTETLEEPKNEIISEGEVPAEVLGDAGSTPTAAPAPGDPNYEIPTEESLSFNQGTMEFGEDMTYDDFGDDYDYDDY